MATFVNPSSGLGGGIDVNKQDLLMTTTQSAGSGGITFSLHGIINVQQHDITCQQASQIFDILLKYKGIIVIADSAQNNWRVGITRYLVSSIILFDKDTLTTFNNFLKSLNTAYTSGATRYQINSTPYKESWLAFNSTNYTESYVNYRVHGTEGNQSYTIKVYGIK